MGGHGKVSPGFLFLCRRKTANLIDNEMHVTAETICVECLWHTTVQKTVDCRCKLQRGETGFISIVIDFPIDVPLFRPMEAYVAHRSLACHAASLLQEAARLVLTLVFKT